MKTKILAACIAASNIAFAQTEIDALRYSRLDFMSTSRQISMGGAFGALGSDISTLSTNPAGIAINSKSSISVNLGGYYTKADATHYGSTNTDTDLSVNIPNLGIILNLDGIISDPNWSNVNFGFARNNLMRIDNRTLISGVNSESTLGNYMLSQADGIPYQEIGDLAYLAFQAFLIDTILGQNALYYTTTPNAGGKQQLAFQETGYILENAFSFGGTYQEKLSIGATLGVTNLSYSYTSQYKEHFEPNSSNEAKDVVFDDNYSTSGNGIHLKVGAIYKPLPWLRFGAALHTPTFYYDMNDNSYIGMDVFMKDGTPYGAESEFDFSYTMTTPSRQMGSIALVSKLGIISFEAEHVLFNTARFSNIHVDDYNFATENQIIRDTYKSALKYKVGGEYRLGNLSLRGGFFYQESSYANSANQDDSNYGYSTGFGITKNRYRLDFAYSGRTQQSQTYLYGNDSFIAASDITSNQHYFTFGWSYLLQ